MWPLLGFSLDPRSFRLRKEGSDDKPCLEMSSVVEYYVDEGKNTTSATCVEDLKTKFCKI